MTSSRPFIPDPRARFLAAWAGLSFAGTLLVCLAFRFRPFLLCLSLGAIGSLATAALLYACLRALRRLKRRAARITLSLASSWTILILIIVASFCLQPDPFQAERIARSGPVLYFLRDRLLRGLFFGVLAGTCMFSWAWLPMAALWHLLTAWIEGARPES